jgi:hypothetical protein
MFGKKEIKKWNESYDNYKYPFRIYYELVVQNKSNKRKLELMGAWKTRSLRIDRNGKEYRDDDGVLYSFTQRWKKEAPVGYDVWQNISNNLSKIAIKIPSKFPEDRKPDIVSELESKTGFGFVWAIFVLHCIYPEVYPLYDQHVYRAFRHIVTNGEEFTQLAPSNWIEYMKYRNFFVQLVTNTSLAFWEVDRALWAFGKYLNQVHKKVPESSNFKSENIKYAAQENINDDWVHSITLGGKAKSFWWKINADSSISISRKFNTKNGEMMIKDNITKEELQKIHEYMKSDWICLANNVQKLKNGTEKEGLGKFVFSKLGWSTTKAQLSSHIGAIFSDSGVWHYNGKKVGIKFKRGIIKWNEGIKALYVKYINDYA